MIRRGIAIMLVLASLIALTAITHADTVGYVTSSGLYIRQSPSTTAKALRCATNGEQLIILREEGDWYYVKYNSAVSGYVAKQYVSTKKVTSQTASSGATSTGGGKTTTTGGGSVMPSKVSDLGKAPNTSRLGDKGSDVTKLQQALSILGYYNGSIDGVYGEGTVTAVMKFQKTKGLARDGVAGKVTILAIFGQEAGNAGTAVGSTTDTTETTTGGGASEMLNWFSGGNRLIPRGATFTIKDVRTGTKIKCKLLYGSNHIDAEPLTASDTAKLKQVYGGAWSWNRRPVLVNYGGRVIAASMNGMPHGEQTIYNNNFDGQFCIHMAGSMTHGSKKVDPGHQSAVKEASKYSW